MPIRITDIDDPNLADYRFVRERDLCESRRGAGLFIGETLQILEQMLAIPGLTKSVLTSDRLAARVAAAVAGSATPGALIFVIDEALMSQSAGFHVHRGVLAMGYRGALDGRSIQDPAFQQSQLLVALDGVHNMDNVGAIFRGAAAFGVGGVILSRNSHDPLYRKCVRVSMGQALHIPFVWSDDLAATITALRTNRGSLRVLAAVCDDGARDIAVFDGRLPGCPPTLLVVGGEYEGITPAVCRVSTHSVRIPIARGVDSLNAAVAASICLHRLSSLA
ncbi:MAG: RNA methyltransferase [Phycisphaerales bacterium]|nr:RNA methyltransferase [Phycisphaerales bacterium]